MATDSEKQLLNHDNEWFDEWDLPADTIGWKIDESADLDEKVVDGVNILARVVGPMFLINAASRNGRYYSKKLWENAIKRSQPVIDSGLMLGTIGHDLPLDDTALLQGIASHRVSKLWIDEKQNLGFGEILVLNTVAGRNLNAYLRGGASFPVSSRARGEYTGNKVNGYDELDAETYQLQTFDFVQVPGVAQAVPRLVENHGRAVADQLDNQNHTNEKSGVDTMSENNNTHTILEKLSTDKVQLQTDLDNALAANKQLTSEKAVLEHKVENFEGSAKSESEKAEELKTKVSALEADVAAYQELGTAEDVAAKVQEHQEMKSQLEKLGSLEDVTKVLENSAKFIEAHGSFEEIVEKLAVVAAYEDLGEPEKLDKALDMLKEYIELGTVEEIQQVFEASVEMANEKAQEAAQAELTELESLIKGKGGDATVAETLLKSMDFEAAKTVAEGLASQSASESKGEDEDGEGEGEANEDVNSRYKKDESAEDVKEVRDAPVNESRAAKFFDRTVVK